MTKEELIRLLSDKYKLPRYAIKQIIDSVPKVMSESLYKREMKGFLVPKLGKFVISPKKAKWIQENLLAQKKEEDRLKEELKLQKKNGN